MSSDADLKAKLLDAIRSDRTMMLGLVGVEDGHTRPMTALLDDEGDGALWFFTSIDNEIVAKGGGKAVASFVSKGHDLFAAIEGQLSVDRNPAVVERLWNPFVAGWYEGKNDPKLRLLRLDPASAQIWENASSLMAGITALFGVDPKTDYRDHVAKVSLR